MARAYSGVLAAIAVIFVILRGLMSGSLPDQILSQCLTVFIGFAVLGYMIGYLAEQTVCDSVENRFRNEIKRLQAEANAAATENAE
ncbi:MAG: hypothetical protein U0892_22185 [Pirellulales bacterium]